MLLQHHCADMADAHDMQSTDCSVFAIQVEAQLDDNIGVKEHLHDNHHAALLIRHNAFKTCIVVNLLARVAFTIREGEQCKFKKRFIHSIKAV